MKLKDILLVGLIIILAGFIFYQQRGWLPSQFRELLDPDEAAARKFLEESGFKYVDFDYQATILTSRTEIVEVRGFFRGLVVRRPAGILVKANARVDGLCDSIKLGGELWQACWNVQNYDGWARALKDIEFYQLFE